MGAEPGSTDNTGETTTATATATATPSVGTRARGQNRAVTEHTNPLSRVNSMSISIPTVIFSSAYCIGYHSMSISETSVLGLSDEVREWWLVAVAETRFSRRRHGTRES